MSVCWMFMILLGCRLSHATPSQSACNCKEGLRTICSLGREKVHVPCPNVTAGIMTFKLQKDQATISSITCNFENKPFNCTSSDSVIMPQNGQNGSISFIVANSSQGIYTCEGTADFPPPFKHVPSEVRVWVLEGHQYNYNKGSCNSEKSTNAFLWIWITVVAFLIIYSITITITALVIWIKWRKMDSQNDYMNTKPRASRDRKKRKGVQNPIPKHF